MSDVEKALERIISNAVYGIGSGDYEIMNDGGYKQDMEQHDNDVAVIRAALENAAVNEELLESLKGIVLSNWNSLEREDQIIRWERAKQAIAKAEETL